MAGGAFNFALVCYNDNLTKRPRSCYTASAKGLKMMEEFRMRPEERVSWSLQALYQKHGYKKYRMGKFEEYELYLENKNFLRSRQIITFNDMDGRVLALKPDVTLSIVKNTHADRTSAEKFYYLENVYRFDKPSGAYREISQLGLEYLGAPDAFATGEVVCLAAATLGEISPQARMQLSNVAFVRSLMEGLSVDGGAQAQLVEFIRHKNAHELTAQAAALGIPPAAAQLLSQVCALSGDYESTMARARSIAITPGMTEALSLMEKVWAQLRALGLDHLVTLDFSLLGDMEYYCGVAFQGYVPGAPRAVLSGGCYANLLRKFGRDIDAIGFAVYLNELSFMGQESQAPDADVLLVYTPADDPAQVAQAAQALRARGLRVRCEQSAPREVCWGRRMTVKEALSC